MMDEWMPIETAPKDGDDILIAGNRVGVGSWGVCRPDPCSGYRANEGRECWRTEGETRMFPEPRFWMPLPNPPSAVRAR